MWVVCMVYVGKDAEELAVDVLDGGGEGLRKVVTWDGAGEDASEALFGSYQIW